MTTSAYVKAIADRAVRTAGQAAALAFGAGQVNALSVSWADVGGFALGGFALSVLTSLATTGLTGEGRISATERVTPDPGA